MICQRPSQSRIIARVSRGQSRISPEMKAKIRYQYFNLNWTIPEIADHHKISAPAVDNYLVTLDPLMIDPDGDHQPAPIPFDQLSDEAKRAWNDFGYFRHRYFGRSTTPWAEHAAHRIEELLATPDKEYVLVNGPPSVGKSTLFMHDLPAWLTVRNRAMRGLIGSSNESLAARYTYRLRSSFDRETLMLGKATDMEHGQAFDAQATLLNDFGRFRPVRSDAIWRRNEFTVEQFGEVTTTEKEATWTAFGQGEQLGQRVDFAGWDDLVTTKNSRSETKKEEQKEFFEAEGEQRIDPGGLFLLQGQRLRADDLYNWAANRVEEIVDDDGFVTETRKVYVHFKYPAHFDERCEGKHLPSEAEPAGDFDEDCLPTNGHCLLDPYRLPYKMLMQKKRTNPANYHTVFQQEDAAPSGTLVPQYMLEGGIDPELEVS